MGVRGRQFAREKFNFVQYIAGLEAMFVNVIRENSPARDFTELARKESALVSHDLPQPLDAQRATASAPPAGAVATPSDVTVRKADSSIGPGVDLEREH